MLKIKSKNGFSLIELMLVVAVIGILAGIVMVPLSGMRERGLETKALAQLSSVIHPMMNCWTDGNEVWFANGSGTADICPGFSAYGQWPEMGDYYSGATDAYQYDVSNIEGQVLGSNADWAFYVQVSATSRKICCNKRNKKCAIIPEAEICNNSLDLTRFD